MNDESNHLEDDDPETAEPRDEEPAGDGDETPDTSPPKRVKL